MPLKIMTEHDYKMVMLCKKENEENIIDEIQKYLKQEYFGNNQNLTMKELYIELAKTFINVSSENDINLMLTYDIPNYFTNKYFSSNFKDKSIDYSDLCKIMISKLTFLKIRANDYLYKIGTNNGIQTFDEYQSQFVKTKKQGDI